MHFVRSFIVIMIGITVVLGIGASVLAASQLENNQWRVELTAEGGQIPQFIDKITFSDGKISSAIFERKKFVPSSFDSKEKGDNALTWEAQQESETNGKIDWQGELQGESMTGTLVWKQPDGKTTKYTMLGAPIPKEEPGAQSATQGAGESTSTTAAKGWFGCSLVH